MSAVTFQVSVHHRRAKTLDNVIGITEWNLSISPNTSIRRTIRALLIFTLTFYTVHRQKCVSIPNKSLQSMAESKTC